MSLFENLSGSNVLLAYYLFKLFGVEAALFIALGQWRRHTSFRARRLTVAFASLTLLQFLLLIAASVNESLGVPLERVVSITSVGLLIWGFTPFFRAKEYRGNVLLAAHTMLAFVLLPFVIAFWDSSTNFNPSSWEILFIFWQIGLLLFGIINCNTNLDDERLYVAISLSVLLFGQIAHAFLNGNYPQPNAPILFWLAEMVAYPVLTVAVYQGAMQSLAARTQEFEQRSEISLDQIKGLVNLFEATQTINTSLELSQVLDNATKSIATALEADECAIALFNKDTALSQLQLTAIHNVDRQGRGEAVKFPIKDQPAIKHAVEHRQQIQVDEYQDNTQLKFLFTLMGAKETGPLLIQPLLQDDTVIGTILLGNSISKRVFSTVASEFSNSLAEQVSVAITHAQAYEQAEHKSTQLSWTLRNQEIEAGKLQAAMETQLKKGREEVSLFAARLYEHEVTVEQQKAALQEAEKTIAQLKQTAEQAQNDHDIVQQKEQQITDLSAEIETYRQQITALEDEQTGLKQQVEQATHQAVEADNLYQALETTNQRVRKLARALRKAREQSSQTSSLLAADNDQLKSLNWGIIIGNAAFQIERANETAMNLLAKTEQEVVGQPLGMLSDSPEWQEAIQLLQSNQQSLASARLKINDHTIRATVSPLIKPDNGDLEGTITILYDTSAEAETQQARDEFLASLSQDLRTPMTSVIGYADLLLGESVGTVSPMQRSFLQRIKANIERLSRLLDGLISLTAIDAGQLELKPIAVDMTEIVEDALINLRSQIDENQLRIEQQLPHNLPPALVDANSAQQIMGNLLANAVKVTPSGQTVAISATPKSNDETQYLQISVHDSGGGIVSQDLPRVFDRFYQADEPLIQGLGETGVGLAIAKVLVEANGGQIWVESEMGDSSTFFFTLPISDQSNDPWSNFLGTLPPLDLNP